MPKNTLSLLMDSLKLPRFDNMEQLAELTGLSSKLLYCLSIKTDKYYSTKQIPKKDTSLRLISIPSYTLSIMQRWILSEILNKISPSSRAMAFRRGNAFNCKQNAFYHSHTLYGLSLDLENFFPSIRSNQVYSMFSNIGYNNFAATILTNLCTLNGFLPQGSPCSPAISNIICISLDKRLVGLCEKRGIRFTRYADDMYFSCDDKALLLKNFSTIKKIIEDEGFSLNRKKTYFHTPSNKKMITGIILSPFSKEGITEEFKVPKEFKKSIRSAIFRCIILGDYSNRKSILGKIAYVEYIESENRNDYLSKLKNYIQKTGEKIQCFPELVVAYNNNLFFTDLNKICCVDLGDLVDEEDLCDLRNTYEQRKSYLDKRNLVDICDYTNWPENVIIDSDEDDFPF